MPSGKVLPDTVPKDKGIARTSGNVQIDLNDICILVCVPIRIGDTSEKQTEEVRQKKERGQRESMLMACITPDGDAANSKYRLDTSFWVSGSNVHAILNDEQVEAVLGISAEDLRKTVEEGT